MLQLPAQAIRITPENQHWFFGYYDIPTFDKTGTKHLCLHVPFMDRLPEKDDIAQLYVIDLETGEKTQVAQTTAWNFQQACMLQWHPTEENTIIYNIRTAGQGCGYGAIVKNLTTGDVRYLDRPVANVAANGKYAVSINFDRVYDLRPGYGYAGQCDRFYDVNHPEEDGIFLTDLTTGKSRLIVSLAQIWDFTGRYFQEDKKICINHITFNTDGSRIVFLPRNFPQPGSTWKTAMVTVGTQGDNMYLLSDYGLVSHYHWRDENVVCFYSDGKEVCDLGNQLYELTDLTYEGQAVDTSFFLADGHNSYSPDRTWILYDSYPKADGYRELYLYDLVTKKGGLLGRYYVTPGLLTDIRCDLHPRWNPSGKSISFDSIHEGFRGVYTMDLTDAMKTLRG